MRGKQQGILTELKPNVNASAVVQKLLEDMRAAVVARNIPKYENLSDQLAVFSRAYVTPSIPNNWQKYNLTLVRYKEEADLYVEIGFVPLSVITHRYVFRVYDRRSGTVICAGETTSWGSLAKNLAREITQKMDRVSGK